MDNFSKQQKYRLTKEDIQNLTCFYYDDSSGLLATVFFNLPLPLKRHSVQVGAVAGQMAKYAPENLIPEGITRDAYANAVRYGCLYHDIGAFLVYNQRQLYPAAGERFLREQIGEEMPDGAARRIILETVQYYGERYDGTGYPDNLKGGDIPLHAELCAVADAVDNIIVGRYRLFGNPVAEAKAFVNENSGTAFSPDAAGCFSAAYSDITMLYRHWRKKPPFWNNSDLKPLTRPIDKSIG